LSAQRETRGGVSVQRCSRDSSAAHRGLRGTACDAAVRQLQRIPLNSAHAHPALLSESCPKKGAEDALRDPLDTNEKEEP
jgi:hypothetical protein